MSQIFSKEKLNRLKKWVKANKNSKFLEQLFLTWKKIRIDTLISLTEMKIIQSNHGVFKNLLSTNQNRAFVLRKFFQNPAWFGLESDFQRFALKIDQFWVILPDSHQNQRTWLFTLKYAFYHWLHTKNSINLMKKIVVATFFSFLPFVTYISNISYFYIKQLLIICFCNCFCVYFYFFDRFNSLNISLIESDNKNKNEHFCEWKRHYPKWSFVSYWTRL